MKHSEAGNKWDQARLACKAAILSLVGALSLLGMLRPVAADVFILASGGRVEGELLNGDEKPRKSYTIKLASGGQISLESSQVKQVITARPDRVEYEKVRPHYPDTVDGQWGLSDWCREHDLPAERKIHLRRVIELDPNHVEARRLLGYSKMDGQWMTQEEWMLKQGYRRYKGQWKLPQEIELLEGKRKQDLAEKEWFQKIKRWRGWLGSDRNKQGRENLVNIDDPMAVKSLAMGLRNDTGADARLLYIEALGKIHTPESDATLAVTTMEDESEDVRLTALEVLQKAPSPMLVTFYVGKLRDKENVTVNRAAAGLARMKDPSSIGPLIDALVTTHKRRVSGGGGGPGSMTTTFGKNGSPGGGLSMNAPPKIVRFEMLNQPVLDALVAITGQNFNFDQRSWRTWYAAQTRSKTLDARRN